MTVAVPQRLVGPRQVGLQLAQMILRQFRLNIGDKVLDECQDKVLD